MTETPRNKVLLKKTHPSIAVVAITPQDTRARLRVERCFPARSTW
jgi:hypothetical protein